MEKLPQICETGDANPKCAQQEPRLEGREREYHGGLLVQAPLFGRWRSPDAARDDPDATLAKLANLFSDIGLQRRGKRVGEIGDYRRSRLDFRAGSVFDLLCSSHSVRYEFPLGGT